MDKARKFLARAVALSAVIQLLGTGVNQAAPPSTSQSFDTAPLWVSSNNTTSPNNYGFTNTSHITGSTAGEAGGNMGSTTLSYYGDPAADTLTPYDNLVASGKLTVDGSSGVSFLGWFDRTQTSFPTLLGFRFAEPNRVQLAYVRPDTGGDQRDTGTFMTLDLGKDYNWTFSYDPTANSGFGAATATFTGIDVVDSESQTLNLHPSDIGRGSRFNTFGILKTPVGDGSTGFFIDNLQYSIPEPASLSVVGLFLTMAMIRRKAIPA